MHLLVYGVTSRRTINPFLIYGLKRLGMMVLTFIVSLILVFILPRTIPGNPLATTLYRLIEGGALSSEQLEATKRVLLETFKFNEPLHIQFVDFISNAVRGNLGISILFYPLRVSDVIAIYIPWTLALMVPAIITSWFVGNYIGVIVALNKNKSIDRILMTTFMVLRGIPPYVLGMYLVLFFAVLIPIFPTGGGWSPGMVPRFSIDFILDYLKHYILPFLSIFITTFGSSGLTMRSIAIQELSMDYMQYAKSIGLSQRKLSMYLFKCSALPQMVGLAISLGWSVAGSVITEIVFGYPGLGFIFWRGIQAQDYPLIQGVFIILISTLLLANFISEILFAYIDPRVKYAYVGV
jgi:peptide/nickel transport system permease protein